jgi:hypothetical protein
MSFLEMTFIPLYPGEAPGNPDLGGWRPWPKQFYTHQEPLSLSLKETIRLVTFRLEEFQVRQAIGIVSRRLAS